MYSRFINLIGYVLILVLRAMLRKSYIFTFVICFIIAVSLIGFAQAPSTFLSLKPGEDVSHSIDLLVDDRVIIKFSVAWGAEASAVGFSLVSPNGTVTDFGEQGAMSYSFVCTEKGQYTMHFDNSDSTTKVVTLEYTIDHYLFGMTTNLFWLVVFALICVVAAVGYVILTRPS